MLKENTKVAEHPRREVLDQWSKQPRQMDISSECPLPGIILGLIDILQIRRPVRVNLIGTGFVPTLRCFGPLPRDSSEGFLVTFTPGGDRLLEGCGEVIFSYPLSQKFCFFHNGRQSIQDPPRRKACTKQASPRVRQEWQYCQSGEKRDSMLEVRINVMTPASKRRTGSTLVIGILETN